MPNATLNQDDLTALNSYADKVGGTVANVAPKADGTASGLTPDDMAAINGLASKVNGAVAYTPPTQSPSPPVKTGGFAPAVSRWAPQAQTAGAKWGVPPALILSIIQHESGGDPNSTNPTSTAKGLGNFLDGTAKQYPNARGNPDQQVDAVGNYIHDLAQRFGGNLRAAVRAYRGVNDVPYINGVMSLAGIGPNTAADAAALHMTPQQYQAKIAGVHAAQTAAEMPDLARASSGDTPIGMTGSDVSEGLAQTPQGIADFARTLAAPLVNAASKQGEYTKDQIAQSLHIGPYAPGYVPPAPSVQNANPVDIAVGKAQQQVRENPGEIASNYLTAAGLPMSLSHAIAQGEDPIQFYKDNPQAAFVDLSIALAHIPGVAQGVHAATFGKIADTLQKYQVAQKIAAKVPMPVAKGLYRAASVAQGVKNAAADVFNFEDPSASIARGMNPVYPEALGGIPNVNRASGVPPWQTVGKTPQPTDTATPSQPSVVPPTNFLNGPAPEYGTVDNPNVRPQAPTPGPSVVPPSQSPVHEYIASHPNATQAEVLAANPGADPSAVRQAYVESLMAAKSNPTQPSVVPPVGVEPPAPTVTPRPVRTAPVSEPAPAPVQPIAPAPTPAPSVVPPVAADVAAGTRASAPAPSVPTPVPVASNSVSPTDTEPTAIPKVGDVVRMGGLPNPLTVDHSETIDGVHWTLAHDGLGHSGMRVFDADTGQNVPGGVITGPSDVVTARFTQSLDSARKSAEPAVSTETAATEAPAPSVGELRPDMKYNEVGKWADENDVKMGDATRMWRDLQAKANGTPPATAEAAAPIAEAKPAATEAPAATDNALTPSVQAQIDKYIHVGKRGYALDYATTGKVPTNGRGLADAVQSDIRAKIDKAMATDKGDVASQPATAATGREPAAPAAPTVSAEPKPDEIEASNSGTLRQQGASNDNAETETGAGTQADTAPHGVAGEEGGRELRQDERGVQEGRTARAQGRDSRNDQRLASDPAAPEYWQSEYRDEPGMPPSVYYGEGVHNALGAVIRDSADTYGFTVVGNDFNDFLLAAAHQADLAEKTGRTDDQGALIRFMANAAQMHEATGAGFSGTRLGGDPRNDVRNTAAHEHVHVTQSMITGGNRAPGIDETSPAGRAYLNSPALAKMSNALAARSSHYVGLGALEAPAFTLAGQWRGFGLSVDEARSLAEAYYLAVEEAHGTAAASAMFRHSRDVAAEVAAMHTPGEDPVKRALTMAKRAKRFNVGRQALAMGDSAPPFYSHLERTIEAKMPTRASAAQVRGILNGAGVKPDEIKWTGLDEFLDAHDGPITKADVLDHVRANGVRLEEVTKGTSPDYEANVTKLESALDKAKDAYTEYHEAKLDEHGYDVTKWPKIDRDRLYDLADARDKINHDIINLVEHGDPTKFSAYQLPGGENYREVLLTLPEAAPSMELPHGYSVIPNPLRGGKAWVVEGPSLSGLTNRFSSGDTREEAIANFHAMHGSEVNNYHSPHWDEPNVVAHIRMNDRTGPNGERVLHVEEVQSDWHQAGRKEGYKVANPTVLDAKRFFGITDDAWAKMDDEDHQSYLDEMNSGQPHVTGGTVPAAPFSKTWHEMALRRVLRYAAEHGYDRVSWTPGEDQAARYDLSKQVDGIEWHEGRGDFHATKNGANVIRKSDVSARDLPDLVGKEVAQKLVDSEPDSHGTRSLNGQQLSIGGAGMRGFYDKIVPDYLNKYGKRWGARVEPTEISVNSGKLVDDGAGGLVRQGGASNAKTVPSIPITDAMRQSVMHEGQPLFQKGEQQHVTRTPAFRRWFGDSKVVDEHGDPLIVYHGYAGEPFSEFSPTQSMRSGFMGSLRPVTSPAYFFSPSPYMARSFGQNRAEYLRKYNQSNIMKVYLSIKRPLDLTAPRGTVSRLLKNIGIADRFGDIPTKSSMWELFDDPDNVAKIKDAGYDGAIISEADAAKSYGEYKDPISRTTYVAFDPTQIKSAVANNGDFDPNEPSILRQHGAEPRTEEEALGLADMPVNGKMGDMDKQNSPPAPKTYDEISATKLIENHAAKLGFDAYTQRASTSTRYITLTHPDLPESIVIRVADHEPTTGNPFDERALAHTAADIEVDVKGGRADAVSPDAAVKRLYDAVGKGAPKSITDEMERADAYREYWRKVNADMARRAAEQDAIDKANGRGMYDSSHDANAAYQSRLAEIVPDNVGTRKQVQVQRDAVHRQAKQSTGVGYPSHRQLLDALDNLYPRKQPPTEQRQTESDEAPTQDAKGAYSLGATRHGGNRQTERGALVLPDASAMRDLAGDIAAKTKNTFVGNLHFLNRWGSPDTVLAAQALGGVKGYTNGLFYTTMGQINHIMGDGGAQRFLGTLTEDRLRGIRHRWLDYSQDVNNLSDDDLLSSNGRRNAPLQLPGWVQGAVDALSRSGNPDFKGIAAHVSSVMDDAIDTGDYTPLRLTLAGLFDKAARSTAVHMTDSEYKAALRDPKFVKALQVYKDTIEPAMAQSHSENEGVFSNALGPLDTYVPLTALDENGEQLHRAGRNRELDKPENLHNNFATGQADTYDASPGTVRQRAGNALRRNTQAHLVRQLEGDGLVVRPDDPRVGKDADGHLTIKVKGREVPAVEAPVGESKTIISDGNTFHTQTPIGVLPKDLARELGPLLVKPDRVFGTSDSPMEVISKALGFLNWLGIQGPLAASIHAQNLYGTYLAESLGPQALSKPGVQDVIRSMSKVGDYNDSSFVSDIAEMGKLGLLQEHYGTSTTDPATAAATGAELKSKYDVHSLLFGEKGVDILFRRAQFRAAKAMLGLDPNQPIPRNADGSFANPKQAKEISDHTNKMGVYNNALQSAVVRSLRQTGLNPFAVASTTMLRNGVRAIGGAFNPKTLPTESAPLHRRITNKIAQQLIGGAVGALAMWAFANYLNNGKWPWNDPDSKLNALKLNPMERRTWLASQIYGRGSNPAYLGGGFVNPIVQRGFNATGLSNAYNAAVRTRGMSPEDRRAIIQMEMTRGQTNSALQPFVEGPGMKAFLAATTYQEPYMTNMVSQGGRSSVPSFMPAGPDVAARNVGWARLWAAGGALNPVIGALAGAAGQGPEFRNRHEPVAGQVTKGLAGVLAPRLYGGEQNGDAQKRFADIVANSQKAADREANGPSGRVRRVSVKAVRPSR